MEKMRIKNPPKAETGKCRRLDFSQLFVYMETLAGMTHGIIENITWCCFNFLKFCLVCVLFFFKFLFVVSLPAGKWTGLDWMYRAAISLLN